MPIPFFQIKATMEPLIDITGWAESYEKLCNKVAGEGEFYNVLEDGFFTTYRKTGDTELGDTLETTDVLGWYKIKAELESNVTKPSDGDVYIVGLYAPYTRWKAEVRGIDIKWIEDGTEEKKILKNYKDIKRTGGKAIQPEEGIYYSVGKTAPYKVYGPISSWEPVGSFISQTTLYAHAIGEIAYVKGVFYLHAGPNNWVQLDFEQPIENYGKHTYVSKDGTRSKIREGFVLGTLEFYSPRG